MVKKVSPDSITVVEPQIWSAPVVTTSRTSASGARLTPDKTKPTTPPDFTAVAVSPTQADLAWGISTDPVVAGQETSGVKGYRVFRNSVKIAQVNASVRTYSATGLTPGNNNQWRVASFDNRNNQSALSAQITVLQPSAPPVPENPDTTPPTVPTNLLATTQGETQINLTWTASSEVAVAGDEESGLAGYKIYRGGSFVDSVLLVTSYADTGLTPATQYSYRVSAVDVDGNESAQSMASVATTTTPAQNPDITPPSVPAGLAAAAQSTSSISLTWSASTDPVIGGAETSGLAGYKVRRGGTVIASPGLVTTYLDSGLTASTSYRYTVSSLDIAGNESAQSDPANVTTPSCGLVFKGDFDQDRQTDVVLQHTDGSVAFWTMSGTTIRGGSVPYVLPAGWQIVAAGDFNHDDQSDFVLQHTDRSVGFWLMRGTTIAEGIVPFLLPEGWNERIEVLELNGGFIVPSEARAVLRPAELRLPAHSPGESP
jgi:chitodextrinase